MHGPTDTVVFLHRNLAYKDPTCSCLASLFVRLLVEDLNEFAYNAEISGINYSISLSVYGIIVSRIIVFNFFLAYTVTVGVRLTL